MKALITLLILIMGVQNQANALPLLAENEAINDWGNLTLYPDHEDPKKFYYFPNSSRLVRDENDVPLFNFTYWGLGNGPLNQAGAYMVFVSKLKSDSEQVTSIKKFLKTKKGGVAVLPVMQSMITLRSTKKGRPPLQKIFDEINFPPYGGRAEDEAGISAVLTGVGAKVFRATLLKKPNAALKVDYCYKVQGLGPDMDAKITVNMKRVYEHFQANAGFKGNLWWRASVKYEVEKLKDKRFVNWEINGGNATDEEYVQTIVTQIIKRMFKPELSTKPSSGSKSSWGFSWFSFNANGVKREELKNEVWNIKRRDLVTREFCVPLVLRDIDNYRDDLVIDADDVDVDMDTDKQLYIDSLKTNK